MRRKRVLTGFLVLAGLLFVAVQPGRSQGLAAADFDKLHAELQSPREPWQAIPWQLSLLEARAQAAKEKKPIYMLCRSGHPLGCV
jgi:hypothetical protein